MNHLKLTHDILDIGKISEIVSAESCGAISIFVGTTRNSFDGKEVISLHYEAYEPMALKQLQLTCEQLRRQWPDIVNIAIYHRLGLVSIKEASVVIAISSPHRETSLKAVAVAIDDLKKRVPIWKKELYNEGTAVWKENKECQWLKKNSAGVDSSFNKTECFVEDPYLLPSQLVQISACEDEIARRIYCFVENKRHEIDQSNIFDFTNVTQNEQEEVEEMACARISSNVTKQEYSKCHLKVRQVENNIGPQTRPNYFNTLDKLMAPINEKKFTSESMDSRGNFYAEKYLALMERLENIQEHLDIPQDKIKSIYQFLKHIEDRLLNLESISPEYVHFLHENFQNMNRAGGSEVFHDIKPNDLYYLERKSYNVQEIDSIIQRFEKGKLDQSNMD